MLSNPKRLFCRLLLGFALAAWSSCQASEGKRKSPLDELPAHIKQVTCFGERADWSHDSKKILFLEKTFGDAYEINLATRVIRPLTHHYFHEGYTRALYLANGDILLSGARQFDANAPWPSRNEKNTELWVLKKDLSVPQTLFREILGRIRQLRFLAKGGYPLDASDACI